MTTSAAWLAAELQARASARRHRLRGDRGEGVVSAAIAILIVAFLGAAMWVGLQRIWTATETKVECQVNQIGGAGAAPPPACT